MALPPGGLGRGTRRRDPGDHGRCAVHCTGARSGGRGIRYRGCCGLDVDHCSQYSGSLLMFSGRVAILAWTDVAVIVKFYYCLFLPHMFSILLQI